MPIASPLMSWIGRASLSVPSEIRRTKRSWPLHIDCCVSSWCKEHKMYGQNSKLHTCSTVTRASGNLERLPLSSPQSLASGFVFIQNIVHTYCTIGFQPSRRNTVGGWLVSMRYSTHYRRRWSFICVQPDLPPFLFLRSWKPVCCTASETAISALINASTGKSSYHHPARSQRVNVVLSCG